MRFHSPKRRGSRVITDAYDEGVAAAHRFEVNERIE